MKLLICDDNKSMLENLCQLLQRLYSSEIQIDTAMLPETLLEDWKIHPAKVADIILMDIEYPHAKKNGIDVAGEIQKKYPGTKIIFITGKVNYAQDIFEVVPCSFLIKPIDAKRLQNAVDKALKQISDERHQNAYFKLHGSVIKIPLEMIQYIESYGHHITLYTKDDNLDFRMKLTECLELLPQDFWLIHQSYIVHARYIKCMTKEGVELWNGKLLPVSRSKYKTIKNMLLDEIEKR